MNHQLDWIDELGEHPNLPKGLRTDIIEDYEEEFIKASVDTETMTSFFKTKYREILWMLKNSKDLTK